MADHRSRADKLRAVYHHPRTGQHEREAARLALARLNEPLTKPGPTARPRPTVQPRRGASPWPPPGSNDFARWFEEMLRTQARPAPHQRTYADFAARTARTAEEVGKAAEAAKAARQAQIGPCPGCSHLEADHMMWRCYGCGTGSRAAWCGWAWLTTAGTSRWVKTATSWQTGPYRYADDGR